ncbi:MAG: hypothetical protein ACOYKE_08900 [Ferruginibacter sp.]
MKLFSLCCLMLLAVIASAQQKDSTTFPANFIGKWKGEMQWMGSGRAPQTFTMQLRIMPTDSLNQYTWQIVYGDANNADTANDNRPYILKPIDIAKGIWVVDERNGIVLDSYVHGNAIHGAFTVQDNTIVDNYTVEGNTMKVEFYSIKLSQPKTSGLGTDDSPTVSNYPIKSYQVGVLKRVD